MDLKTDGAVIHSRSNARKHGIHISRLSGLNIAYICIHRLDGISLKGYVYIIKDHLSRVVDAKHHVGFRANRHGIRHYINIAGAQTGILLYGNIHNNAFLCIFKLRAVILFFYRNAIGALIHTCLGCEFSPDLCGLARSQRIHNHRGRTGLCGKNSAVGNLFRFQIKQDIRGRNRSRGIFHI